jgi:transposase-like protein
VANNATNVVIVEDSLSNHQLSAAIPPEVKQLCLKMYLNGMGLRGIERVTEIHHTTIINWIKEAGLNLPDVPKSLRYLK